MKKKKVSVLYVLTKLELGGAQKVCLSLLKGVAEHGNFSSLASGSQGVLVNEAKQHTSTFLLPEFTREVGLKGILNEIKTFRKLTRIIKQLKIQHPDLVVHTHSTKAGILGRWAAFFAGVKKRVHTVHGFGFNNHQRKIVWYLIYAVEYLTSLITTHFVCVSQEDRNTGIKLFPKFKEKSSIIRAAVDWDKFYIPARTAPTFDKKEDFVIGTVSCFKPQKNLLDLLQAFQEIIAQSKELSVTPKLEIIGDGMMRKEIEAFITNNNLIEYVTLLGWQHDTTPFLKRWRLFTMSSLWEGLPCAIIEARLSKLPVVAYNVGGIAEVIQDGKNGFLIPAKNWKLLAKKITLLLSDTNLYQKMSSHQDALEDFKNNSMITQHIKLYEQLP